MKSENKYLHELVTHKKGFAFKSKDYVTNGVPVIRVSNFTDDTISNKDLKFVSTHIGYSNKGVTLKPNDIVIATVGSWPNNPDSVVGRTIIVPNWASNALMNQNAVILRVINQSLIDQKFIYYQMKTLAFSNYLISKAQGSANQASITLDAIFSYSVYWPSELMREYIVSILSLLDDRITLLRETNTTLEAIAQALFKSWFIDFDPVHAKMQGQIPEGMDEATAALFPDSFEESELGPIPKGWSLGTLADLSTLNPESWTTKSKPKKILYLDLANVKQNIISQISVFDFKDAPSRAKRVLRDGDTIIGTVRPGNRSFAFIAEPIENLTGSTGFAVLRPKIKINTEFLYLAATNNASIDYLQNIADGGAYPAVRPEKVIQLNCTLPTHSIMQKFGELTNNLLKKISVDQKEIYTLSKIRDSLLPKLISGEISLKSSN